MNQKIIILSILAMFYCSGAFSQPDCINEGANEIMLNGDDWSGLIANLRSRHRANHKFTIVHIGDSHIQPGVVSDEVRRALQERYGNGGRGLLSPLALASTNQPGDYTLRSSSSISSSSRMLSQGSVPLGSMTGVQVKFAGGATTLSIGTRGAGDEFYRIMMFHSRGDRFTVSQQGRQLKSVAISDYATSYVLSSLSDTARLHLEGNGYLYGIRLLNSKRGVVVDCIGNNGATYSSYCNIGGFASQLRDLEPQLVIISLGTNEAHGRFSSLTTYIDKLLSSIRRECPNVKFLLTTPLETQQQHSRGYSIQSNVAEVRDMIVNYGRSHKIAVWDFYRVGGGAGASGKWISSHHMSSDRIHLTDAGYHLQGKLLAKALLRLFDPVTLETDESIE